MSDHRLLAALVTVSALAGAAPVASASGAGASASPSSASAAYRMTATAKLTGATLLVRVTLRRDAKSRALPGATVRVRGRSAITDGTGEARIALPAPPRRPLSVRVAKGDLRKLTMTVRPRTTTS